MCFKTKNAHTVAQDGLKLSGNPPASTYQVMGLDLLFKIPVTSVISLHEDTNSGI